MSLTPENIRFIDTYLQKAEVAYADVRMEVVDHVASEVETAMTTNNASFYDAFKAYMVAHKKELLKTNKKFKWVAEKKVWVALGKQLLKPQVFLFGPLVYLILSELQKSFDIAPYLIFFPILLFLVFGIFYAIFKGKKNRRFSGIERAGAVFALVIQTLIIVPWERVFDFSSNHKAMFIFNALVVVIIIAFLKVFQDYRKEYSKFPTLDFV